MSIRTSREDYLLRLIREMAAVAARMLRLRADGRLDEAMQVASDAEGELLGPLAAAANAVDAATAARLLGEPLKVAAWARLLAERAALLRAAGEDAGAGALEERAALLAAEARSRAGASRSAVDGVLAGQPPKS